MSTTTGAALLHCLDTKSYIVVNYDLLQHPIHCTHGVYNVLKHGIVFRKDDALGDTVKEWLNAQWALRGSNAYTPSLVIHDPQPFRVLCPVVFCSHASSSSPCSEGGYLLNTNGQHECDVPILNTKDNANTHEVMWLTMTQMIQLMYFIAYDENTTHSVIQRQKPLSNTVAYLLSVLDYSTLPYATHSNLNVSADWFTQPVQFFMPFLHYGVVKARKVPVNANIDAHLMLTLYLLYFCHCYIQTLPGLTSHTHSGLLHAMFYSCVCTLNTSSSSSSSISATTTNLNYGMGYSSSSSSVNTMYDITTRFNDMSIRKTSPTAVHFLDSFSNVCQRIRSVASTSVVVDTPYSPPSSSSFSGHLYMSWVMDVLRNAAFNQRLQLSQYAARTRLRRYTFDLLQPMSSFHVMHYFHDTHDAVSYHDYILIADVRVSFRVMGSPAWWLVKRFTKCSKILDQACLHDNDPNSNMILSSAVTVCTPLVSHVDESCILTARYDFIQWYNCVQIALAMRSWYCNDKSARRENSILHRLKIWHSIVPFVLEACCCSQGNSQGHMVKSIYRILVMLHIFFGDEPGEYTKITIRMASRVSRVLNLHLQCNQSMNRNTLRVLFFPLQPWCFVDMLDYTGNDVHRHASFLFTMNRIANIHPSHENDFVSLCSRYYTSHYQPPHHIPVTESHLAHCQSQHTKPVDYDEVLKHINARKTDHINIQRIFEHVVDNNRSSPSAIIELLSFISVRVGEHSDMLFHLRALQPEQGAADMDVMNQRVFDDSNWYTLYSYNTRTNQYVYHEPYAKPLQEEHGRQSNDTGTKEQIMQQSMWLVLWLFGGGHDRQHVYGCAQERACTVNPCTYNLFRNQTTTQKQPCVQVHASFYTKTQVQDKDAMFRHFFNSKFAALATRLREHQIHAHIASHVADDSPIHTLSYLFGETCVNHGSDLSDLTLFYYYRYMSRTRGDDDNSFAPAFDPLLLKGMQSKLAEMHKRMNEVDNNNNNAPTSTPSQTIRQQQVHHSQHTMQQRRRQQASAMPYQAAHVSHTPPGSNSPIINASQSFDFEEGEQQQQQQDNNTSSSYTPAVPAYSPSSPSYIQTESTYSPTSPTYAPNSSPRYNGGDNAAYSPTSSPQYSPGRDRVTNSTRVVDPNDDFNTHPPFKDEKRKCYLPSTYAPTTVGNHVVEYDDNGHPEFSIDFGELEDYITSWRLRNAAKLSQLTNNNQQISTSLQNLLPILASVQQQR